MSKSRAVHNREEKKKPTEYSYGRGGRLKTTDLTLANRGKIDPATYMPSGTSGSLKVQSMQKKKARQEADQQNRNKISNVKQLKETTSAYENAFGKKKKLDRVR